MPPRRASAATLCDWTIMAFLTPVSLSASARAALPASPLAMAEVPLSLIWLAAIVIFGVLLMACVLVLLKREVEPSVSYEPTIGPAARRGQYLQHLNRLLRAIRTINSLIVTERDGDRLLQRACESLTATRGYRMAWIGLVEEGSPRVQPVAQAGFEQGYLDQIVVTLDDSPTGQGPTGRAIRTGEPAVMRDIETDPEYAPWREQALQRGYRSSASVPLRFEGRVLAALNVYADMPDAFDIEEVGLLQEVGDHLAYALGSIELGRQLREARRQVRRAEPICAAFEQMPVGVLVTDGEGLITGANRRVVQMLDGYESAEDLVGRAKLTDLPPFAGPEARRGVEALLERGEPVRFRCTAPAGKGERRTLACRAVTVDEAAGGPAQAVWLIEDVRERPAEGEAGGDQAPV